MSNYILERNKKNNDKLRQIVLTLPDYCTDFFIGIEQSTSVLTRLNYASDINIFFYFLSTEILNKPIKDISLSDLENLKSRDYEMFLSYISDFTKDGVDYHNTDCSKARKLSAIRALFKYLYNSDRISHNETAKLKTPKIHTKPIIHLEPDEVAKLLNESENPTELNKREMAFNRVTSVRDTALLSLFLGTGIRVSECVGLNVKDIDLENNAFKITRKGGNQTILYFSEEVKEPLVKWIKERKYWLSEDSKEDALFLSLQKKRICVRAVEKLVKKYSGIASPLKKITPHKLRSTYGTTLYQNTNDIYVVAEVLGHKDINTTKEHYASMSDEIKRSVVNKVKLR
ncbi:MAG: tyrosine-type recombinase/integrase [Eubacteriales bacterium]|nr:tyrosine-type recombinase/integrase [Eubacteriales bacterium]